MSDPSDPFTLSQWRRRVAEIYAAVRQSSNSKPEAAWQAYREARDNLFRSHLQSPLEEEQRAAFECLPYFGYDPRWRVIGQIDFDVVPETMHLQLSEDGDFFYSRVARTNFRVNGIEAQLSLFWIQGYGGGLFLPFRDSSNGRQTFGGGRYLYDTIKGADLGVGPDEMLLDFNYAYNPSCAYNSHWVCPLAPIENQLPFSVEAGEKAYTSH